MGFFNFYLGLGLSFWGLALFRRTRGTRRLAAAPVLALATYAHALPAAWALGAGTYLWLAGKVKPRRRIALAFAALGAVVAVSQLISAQLSTTWMIQQALFLSGADQAWVGGIEYYPAVMALGVAWAFLLARVLALKGLRRLATTPEFEVCLLTAAVVVLMPTTIFLSGFNDALKFISPRMSLATAVLICAILAPARPRGFERVLIAAAPLCFFAPMLVNNQALNRLESQVKAVVTDLPPGARVVNGLRQTKSRIDLHLHMVDRACMGHCFSYANYEPSTGQFSVRAMPGNRVVLSSRADVFAVEHGTYVVKPSDTPLYEIRAAGDRIRAELLQPGNEFALSSGGQQ